MNATDDRMVPAPSKGFGSTAMASRALIVIDSDNGNYCIVTLRMRWFPESVT